MKNHLVKYNEKILSPIVANKIASFVATRIFRYLYNHFVRRQFPTTNKNSAFPWFRPLDCASNKGQRFPKESALWYRVDRNLRSSGLIAPSGKIEEIFSCFPMGWSFELVIPLENRKYSFASTYFNETLPLMSRRSRVVNLDFASVIFEVVILYLHI